MIVVLGDGEPEKKTKNAKAQIQVKDSEMQRQFTIFEEILDNLEIENRNKIASKFEVVGKARKTWLAWFLGIIIIVLVINITNMQDEYSILSVCAKMMKNMNELMDSENYVIEAYCDFKSKFVLNF